MTDPTRSAPSTQFSPPTQSSPSYGQAVALPGFRRVVGDVLSNMWEVRAQLTSVVDVDVTELLRLQARAREDFSMRTGVRLSATPFFVKAAAQALKAHPVFNAQLDTLKGTVTYLDTENVGIAVDTREGLMTPVIRAAGDLSIAAIARATTELCDKAHTGRLTPDDVSGATITVSRTGSRGDLFDSVIVPQGQAATLGVGSIQKCPVVDACGAGATGIRDVVSVSLSYDHHLVDRSDAADYLETVRTLLESVDLTEQAADRPLLWHRVGHRRRRA